MKIPLYPSLLYFICLFLPVTAYSSSTQKNTSINRKASTSTHAKTIAKHVVNLVAAFDINYGLSYLSVFAHEYGHGIACNNTYSIEMIPTKNPFGPWSGLTTFHEINNYLPLAQLLAGPLAGIAMTCLQCISIAFLNSYFKKNSKKKTIKHSVLKAVKFPLYFIQKLFKVGKQYPYITKKLSFLDYLLYLRMVHLTGEIGYGLLPYNQDFFKEYEGDGERIWEILSGQKCASPFNNTLIEVAQVIIIMIPLYSFCLGCIKGAYDRIKIYRSLTNRTTASAPIPSKAINSSGLPERGSFVTAKE